MEASITNGGIIMINTNAIQTDRKPRCFLALALFCLCLGSSIQLMAQEEPAGLEDCAGGTYYLIAYPDTTTNTYDDRDCCRPQFIRNNTHAFSLLIYSPVDQLLDIGHVGGAGQKVPIAAGQILEYNTEEIGVPLITDINTPKANVLKIETKFPVVVYCYMMSPFGTEAFTAIPVEWWGTEYFAAAWPGEVLRNVFPNGEFNYTAVPKEGEAEILIIAAYDNTQVRIDPNAPLRDCHGCKVVTLNKGEAYLVQSTTDTSEGVERQPDLAGTFIQASKRIGVISGNPRVMHNKGVRPSLAENSFMNMAIEWISPIEQHGTEFVYLPTWDDRRQSDVLPLEESRDQELVRLYATREGETQVHWKNTAGVSVPGVRTPVNARGFTHEKIGVPQARSFTTSQPAMAYMSPHAVVKFNGTTNYFQNYIGASYLSWSTYMVELVPREQWTSFAPVRAPSIPSGMAHFLNLVTDSANQFNVYVKQGLAPRQLFPFNRGQVPGTDLVWGSIPLNDGVNYYIEGDDGATFYGFAYGSHRGQEQYRPGRTRKKDDDKSASIAGGDSDDYPASLHPSEYEEDVAMMYGFPLAPSRCVLAPPDEYEISVVQGCEIMEIHIKTKNDPASGIRSVTLLPDSSRNVQLEFIDPVDPLTLKSDKVTEATLRVVALDPRKDAYGVVIIRDRTRESKRWRVEYTWSAERVDLNPSDVLDFGKVTIGEAAGERVVTITNPLTRSVFVRKLDFASLLSDFVITRTAPEFPNNNWSDGLDSIELAPGQSLKVWIDITPKDASRTYRDSLRIRLGCVTVTLPLKAATAVPCIFVSDLDFGTMNAGESRRLDLKVCNQGDGEIRFESPLLDWLEDLPTQLGFSVDPIDIDNLKGVVLKKDECVTIPVTFTASKRTGPFRTTARFWANTRSCRDTSNWRANVVEPGPQIDPYNWGERWLSENACTKNPEERYPTTIQTRNTGTSPFEVVELTIENDPLEVFEIVSSVVVPGLIMRPGDVHDITISFDPKEEQVYYATPATIRMTYKIVIDGVEQIDYVENTLEGIGIESYATISDQDFGRLEFKGPRADKVSSSVVIQASGTRPVSIDRIVVNPANHFEIQDSWLSLNPWSEIEDHVDAILKPGETIVVPIDFIPGDADPLTKSATVDIIGDFAFDACSETDSTGILAGEVYVLGASAEGYDFGSMLTCFEGDGFVTVMNYSTDPVQIANVSQPVPLGAFTVDPTLRLPIVLAPKGDPDGGDRTTIPVHFAPIAPGDYAADVTATILNQDGTNQIAVLTASLTGKATDMSVSMSIGRLYSTFPGLPLSIPVMLDDDPADARVTSFILNLSYDDGMMLLTDVGLGSLFPSDKGWELDVISKTPGELTVRISNSAGQAVTGTGEALVLDFITYIGDKVESEIPFNITVLESGANDNPCIRFTTSPGHAKLDEICGLNFRLIRLTSAKYSVGQAVPNVVRTMTDIEFSIGLDAPTTVEVFDHNGDKVGVLVNRHLQAGSYRVTWDAGHLPSGRYFYRITSGHWTGTNEVIVRK